MSEKEVLIVRSLVDWSGAKAITIPKFWLRTISAREGRELRYVLLRVSGDRIVVEPLFDEELAKKLSGRKRGEVLNA